MSVTFQKTRLSDSCLQNDCAICLSTIDPKDGSAHIPSLRGSILRKRPILENAVHSECLNRWAIEPIK
ncbi:MAG: hypothetical protein H0X29_09840 [Parachlamydiaceae bacterium]|nr:hypothetical protein [Parachlamydiaceae bacterium]